MTRPQSLSTNQETNESAEMYLLADWLSENIAVQGDFAANRADTFAVECTNRFFSDGGTNLHILH